MRGVVAVLRAAQLVLSLTCCSSMSGEITPTTVQSTSSEPPVDAGLRAVDGDVSTAEPEAPHPTADSSVPDSGSSQRVTIAATGDLVLSRRLVKAWQARGDNGLAWMLQGYRSLLGQEEIVYLNLETPLVNDEVPLQVGWPPVLGAPPGAAEVLAEMGVDVVSLANNHAYDQGHAGLGRTLALLDASGVHAVGAGPTVAAAFEPTVIERGQVRVAFLGFTGPMNLQVGARGAAPQHVARLWDEARVFEAVAQSRNVADLVVVCAHWSRDFQRGVPRGLRRLAHQLVDAGADVIVGSGPHILHEVERLESERGEAVVAYSLGNLLSSMAFRHRYGRPTHSGYVHPANVIPEARDGVLLNVVVDLAGEHIRIETLEAIPLWTSNNYAAHISEGVPPEIRVVPLREAPEAIAQERRPIIESALGDQVELIH